MSTYLVTGGAGFIGSHLVDYLLKANPHDVIVNIDKLTYAGSLENISYAIGHERHHFIQGDINDVQLLEQLFSDYSFEGVYHLAAESHVDNSITGPKAFIETNIYGTFNLLEQARKMQVEQSHFRFLHVSTDEVYGSLGEEGYFTESSPYQPNSPYSASKAASDMLVRSYNKTYGLQTIITNCSNNFGPRQHLEKLIPTVISKALKGESIPVYGTGANIRDWLFVSDHCAALHKAFQKGISGEVYNIGTHQEMSNLELVSALCGILDNLMPNQAPHYDLVEFVSDRPGHDFRYAIDSTKMTELGWHPQADFSKQLELTVKWYLDKIVKLKHHSVFSDVV